MPGEPILVVDDTPVNLKLTRIVLEHEGYEVRTAESAEEALRLLDTFRPRVVLADIQMPGMDGLEMTRRIKADPRNRDMLVVALTAFALTGDEEKARAAGCDGYITKPIDTRTLGRRIREYLHDTSGDPHPGEDPFAAAAAGIDDLRGRFLEEAGHTVPQWLEDLNGRFNAGEAQATAHTWVGSGGLLGFRRISMLAREAETILRQKPVDTDELRSTLDALLKELQDPILAEDEPAPPPPPPAPAAGPRPLVLIADDDHNVRAMGKALLGTQEIDCDIAADGRAALAAIRGRRPQVVVLDVNMPGMTGYEVLAAVRAEKLPIKVLLLTADEHPDTRDADDFLVKPFNPIDLVVRIAKLLKSSTTVQK